MMPRTWFSAPNEPSVHCSESAVATVTGFAPAAPTAQPFVVSLNDTLCSSFDVGKFLVHEAPASAVRAMTPLAPAAQPCWLSAKQMSLKFSLAASVVMRDQLTPPFCVSI